jgi:outer membrane protein OmpA-like peptidoglycan-associated protein
MNPCSDALPSASRRLTATATALALCTSGVLVVAQAPTALASTCPAGTFFANNPGPNPPPGFAAICEASFTASDPSWAVPSGVEMFDLALVGGGGGGGGGLSSGSGASSELAGGMGGAGGEVVVRLGLAATSTISVTIGNGGTGGSASTSGTGNAGTNGNDTTVVVNNVTYTALGGVAGPASATGSSPQLSSAGSNLNLNGTSTPTVGSAAKRIDSNSNPSATTAFNLGGAGAGAGSDGLDNATNQSGTGGGAASAGSSGWGLFDGPMGMGTSFGGGGGAGGIADNGTANATISTGGTGPGGAGSNTNQTHSSPDGDSGFSAGAAGAGGGAFWNGTTVAVGNGGDGDSGKVLFRFYAPPIVSSISPSTGIEAGDTITVSGSNLSVGSVQVTVGGTSVTPTSSSATQIVFTAPSLSPGSQTVLVETLNSSSTVVGSLSQTITYASPAPPAPNPGPNPGPAPAPAGPTDPATPSSSGSSTGGGGASNVAPTPTSLPPASSANGAVVLVGGQQVAVTTTPLGDSTSGSGEGTSSASSLPPRLQRQLPPSNGSQLVVGDSTLTVKGPQLGGSREGSSLAVAPGAPVDLALSGFQAGTEVGIYVINEDGTFVLIGTTVVDADGSMRSSVTVPTGAVTGTGRLQIQGTNASGAALTVALDAQILPPVAPVSRATGALPEVKPGRVSVINAEGEAVRSSVERVNGTDIRIRAQGSSSNIQAVDSDGVRPLGSQGAIEVEEEGFVRLGGSGFQPNSTVEVWMFSDPTFVGVVQTDAEGNYNSLLQMPDALQPGEHTLQSAGTARNGTEIAASAGLRVTQAENASGTAGSNQRELKTTVYFDRMSSHLDAADRKKLDRIATKVGNRSTRVNITGYVQASSDTSNDKSLSTARARAVAKYLRSKGVRGTFTVRGVGVFDGPSDKARSARVEIRVG